MAIKNVNNFLQYAGCTFIDDFLKRLRIHFPKGQIKFRIVLYV